MYFTNIKQNTDEFIADLWMKNGGLEHITTYKITGMKWKKLSNIFASFNRWGDHIEIQHIYYINKIIRGNDIYFLWRFKDTYNSFVVCLGLIKNNKEINIIPLSLFLSELM